MMRFPSARVRNIYIMDVLGCLGAINGAFLQKSVHAQSTYSV